MLLESDSSWLTLAGPYPMLPRLSAPVRGSTPTSAVRLSAVQPPTALFWVASSTLIRVPLPLPDTARFHVQESFVWFRAKTDSSALAAYPHSATMTRPGIESRSPGPLANTQPTRPMSLFNTFRLCKIYLKLTRLHYWNESYIYFNAMLRKILWSDPILREKYKIHWKKKLINS